MMKIKEIIVVEGKYDEIAIRQICDATVLQTRGFKIFKDTELKTWIKSLAEKRGIIILTDSDESGFKIRQHIESFVDKKYIKNAYIPTIEGKEKRKEKPSSEGLLGVEGVSKEVLLKTLERVSTVLSESDGREKITKADLYENGICGKENSVENKRKLLKKLKLPLRLSNNKLLEALNCEFSKAEFEKLVKEI